jgi:fatty acyl-CoA reductase
MAERTLRKKRDPNLPTLLIRPSIISGAMKEPRLGWTDTISAAGGLSLVGGIGIVNWIHGHRDNIADLIPVDVVSNMIIAATAVHANNKSLRIVHTASSHRMPLTWGKFRDYTFEYLKHHPYDMQVFKPDVHFIPDDRMFKGLFFVKNQLPVKVMEVVAKIPGISAGFKKTVE